MTMTERQVAVPGGDLAVLDYGGSGPDVLLIHSAGHNAHTWIEVAPFLAQHAHVYAFDLRGHGQSSAEVTEGSMQTSDDVVRLIEGLGLERPVVVAHEFGGMYAVAAAVECPAISGLVLVDSAVVETTDAVRDLVSMIADPMVLDLLEERFGLGRSGPDAASLAEYVDSYVERIREDWMARTWDGEAARRLVLRGVVIAEDGSWARRPTLQTVQDLAEIPSSYPYYPGRELMETLGCAIQVITLTSGHFAPADSVADRAAANPTWQFVALDVDAEALNTHPRLVAAPIVAFLESLRSEAPST
ncbi:pimeloyl-ACP methyl ester carboxylesterase [Kineosphaera limosa]|nr:alpha/beta fold hydrolase [Kineosphaera limosa]NYE01070.1 pimeloyl-ACP methyl ester carboxylesterase [Kineosphaera limosa]